ncbi:MAG: ABC transporter substrate-binding protein [Myxococcales bacterium]|nr:ABC transporter substrate-binding protein [Myxococcales bacterium]
MSARATTLAACLALASSGCSGELPAPIGAAHGADAAPTRGGTLRLATFGDVRSLDPANLADGLAPMIDVLLYAGLVDYDATSKIRPDLAERWEITDGGKRVRFFIKPGARFHDGEEVTADDVKRSAERALHPSTPNPYASFYESIDGYEAYAAGKADELRGVVVEGRHVVSFVLTAPDATFLPVMALMPLRPVCKSAGHRYSDAWQPCGAGPFKLAPGAWERGRQAHVTRFERYHRAPEPYLDGVEFTFLVHLQTERFKFERGELDVLRDFVQPDLLRFQADPRWAPFGEYEGERQIGGEAMNVEVPPFDRVEVRRAVAAAIDREQIRMIKSSNLRAAYQAVPPGVPGHNDKLACQSYDLARALDHMKRAGLEYDPATGKGGWPDTIPYLVYRQGLPEFTAQVLAQQLAKIGLRIEVRVVNYATFMALRGRRKRSPFGPGMWTQDYPHPADFLEPLFHSKSISAEDSNNWSFYSNARLDETLDRAKRELDDAKRQTFYDDAQKIVCDDAPWAFTYAFRWYTQRQPYVRGYRTHPMWTHDLSTTWLDRVAGPTARRAVFSPGALGALFGGPRR